MARRPPGLADLGAGAGDEDDRRHASVRARRARARELRTWSTRVRGRQRDAQPRGAGRHGRRPDRRDEQPAVEQRARPRRARAPRRRTTTGTIGDGWPGPELRRRWPAAGPAASSPSGLADDLERGERGGGVGRGRRGGEDVRAGPVHDELGERGRARRRTRRARRASSTACRRAATVGVRSSVGVGSEHRVRLVEHEQRAVVRAQLGEARRRRRRRRPSRTRCR